jgi:DNA-binding transcriptional regulator YhcF (GntR family)
LDYQLDRPIYLQIMKDMKMKIVSGQWEAGMHVASVRDLAVAYRVNPNTMQRALAEMEREGLMATDRTIGRLVTQDAARIAREREQMAAKGVRAFLEEMNRMGFSRETIMAWITREIQATQEKEG